MRISAILIRNYKRLREVEIVPEADRTLVLIGGLNAQGKSSVLGAFEAALGGAGHVASDPVRHGADKSEIVLKFDDGALVVRRDIRPDGSSTLEVRNPNGVVKSPQALLNKIVGARFLDPHAFLSLKPSEQRANLLTLIDVEKQLDEMEQRRARIYDKRTEVGRDLKKAEGEIARLPEVTSAPAPIDVAALSAELRQFADQQRAGDALGSVLKVREAERQQAVAALANHRTQIAALEQQLAALRAQTPNIEKQAATCADNVERVSAEIEAMGAEWKASAPRREQLEADLKRADAHNRAVFEAEAVERRRVAARELIDQLENQIAQQTELLDKIEAHKIAFLAAAKLPVDGLGVEADGLTFNGVPFAQASGAEQLRVALGIAIAASPNLEDIWIRDGSLFDDESLRLISEQAAAANRRLWVERVGDRDPGAIVIQDGALRVEKKNAG